MCSSGTNPLLTRFSFVLYSLIFHSNSTTIVRRTRIHTHIYIFAIVMNEQRRFTRLHSRRCVLVDNGFFSFFCIEKQCCLQMSLCSYMIIRRLSIEQQKNRRQMIHDRHDMGCVMFVYYLSFVVIVRSTPTDDRSKNVIAISCDESTTNLINHTYTTSFGCGFHNLCF